MRRRSTSRMAKLASANHSYRGCVVCSCARARVGALWSEVREHMHARTLGSHIPEAWIRRSCPPAFKICPRSRMLLPWNVSLPLARYLHVIAEGGSRMDPLGTSGGTRGEQASSSGRWVQFDLDEHEARASEERRARTKPTAWCDFCGSRVAQRRCCLRCQRRGNKAYFCDRQCQMADWYLPPRHKCGNLIRDMREAAFLLLR